MQKQRVGDIKHEGLKDNFRGLAVRKKEKEFWKNHTLLKQD